MVYWLTDTAASSARMYSGNAEIRSNSVVVDLPVGCSIFPHEVFRAPGSWAERFYPNLIHLIELDQEWSFRRV
jgi:hypothetical protein